MAEPRTPGVLEMAPPLLLAPVIAPLLFALSTGGWQMPVLVAGAAAATALVIGWPVLFWAYDNGRTSILSFAIIGAVVGAAPFAAAVASGAAGQYIMSTNLDYVAEVLRRGVSVPLYGQLSWPKFLRLAATGMAAGVLWAIGAWAIANAATRLRSAALAGHQ